MDVWVKRGALALGVLGVLVVVYLAIKFVLPTLMQTLGLLAHIIGWLVLIVAIIFAIWFLVQKLR